MPTGKTLNLKLSNIEITHVSSKRKYLITSGLITCILDMIEVVGGDQIPGMMRWLMFTDKNDSIPNDGERVAMKSGEYSGMCLLISSQEGELQWKGTGPLEGFNAAKSFNVKF
jgi:hypothetical protein